MLHIFTNYLAHVCMLQHCTQSSTCYCRWSAGTCQQPHPLHLAVSGYCNAPAAGVHEWAQQWLQAVLAGDLLILLKLYLWCFFCILCRFLWDVTDISSHFQVLQQVSVSSSDVAASIENYEFAWCLIQSSLCSGMTWGHCAPVTRAVWALTCCIHQAKFVCTWSCQSWVSRLDSWDE